MLLSVSEKAECLATEKMFVSDVLHVVQRLLVLLQKGVLGCWVWRGCMSSPSSPLCFVPVHSTCLLLHWCSSARNFDSTLRLSLKAPPVQSVPVNSVTCQAPLLPCSSSYLFCPLSVEPGLPAVRKHCHPFSNPQRPLSEEQPDLILELTA